MTTDTRGPRPTGEVLMAGALIAVAVWILYQCIVVLGAEGAASGGAMQNAALYPEYLAVALLLLAVAQIGIAIRDFRKPYVDDNIPDSGAPGERAGNTVRALLVTLVLISYFLCVPYVGYLLATPIMLAAMFAILGVTNPVKLALIPIAISLAISLFFENGLGVILPVGRLASWF